jgi:hypothetical protein
MTELRTHKHKIAELEVTLARTTEQLSTALQQNVDKDDLLLAATRKHDSELLFAVKEIEKKENQILILTKECAASKKECAAWEHNLKIFRANEAADKLAFGDAVKELEKMKQLHGKCADEIKSLKKKISSDVVHSGLPSICESNLRDRLRDSNAEVARLNILMLAGSRRYKIDLSTGILWPVIGQVNARVSILKTSLSDAQLNALKSNYLLYQSSTYISNQENGALVPTYVQVPMDRVIIEDPNATLSNVDIEICRHGEA